VIAAAILLAGCGGIDRYLYDDPPASGAEASGDAPRSAAPVNAHCVAVARQRALDAEAGGEDEETVEAVRRGTYDDCFAWDAKHGQ